MPSLIGAARAAAVLIQRAMEEVEVEATGERERMRQELKEKVRRRCAARALVRRRPRRAQESKGGGGAREPQREVGLCFRHDQRLAGMPLHNWSEASVMEFCREIRCPVRFGRASPVLLSALCALRPTLP
jgi:hypothetical protein